MDPASASGNRVAIQEAIVSNFITLLGASSAGTGKAGIATVSGVTSSAKPEDFLACISDSVSDSDVVCTMPSLEIPPPGKKGGGDFPLPKVGETHRVQPVPEMAASVLGSADATSDASTVEEETAKHMTTLTSWTKSTLVYAPQAASKSVSTSFSTLVDSRVKAWTLLLLRQSLNRGDTVSRSCLLSMLSSSLEIRSATTSFKTLPLPPSAYQQPREADVILPVLFEAELKIAVQGRQDKVNLRAPGTVSANFAKSDGAPSKPGLTKVAITLDTKALLESMVEQARLVVFKAVARATPGGQKAPKQHAPATNGGGMDSSFSSALNLSDDAAAQSTRLQKAKSSALRLNSILQGKSDGTGAPMSKTRKNRSVQWGPSLNVPSKDPSNNVPSAKRQRFVQSQARLKSMKSFGRPHAEHGYEPKNATFNDFGRPVGPTWGKDGKLRNHPVPMNSSRQNMLGGLGAAQGSSSKNATFDLSSGGGPVKSRTRISPQLAAGLSFGRTQSRMGLGGALPSTLPRTATALESWLVKKAQG